MKEKAVVLALAILLTVPPSTLGEEPLKGIDEGGNILDIVAKSAKIEGLERDLTEFVSAEVASAMGYTIGGTWLVAGLANIGAGYALGKDSSLIASGGIMVFIGSIGIAFGVIAQSWAENACGRLVEKYNARLRRR
ncbi:MAG: hypothetical protein ACUVXI_06350 [bacterium]